MRKVAVVGSRTYPKPGFVRIKIYDWVYNSPWNETVQIVSGHGGIVDLTAEKTINDLRKKEDAVDIPEPKIFPPDYERYGRYVAPKIRNTEIVEYCDEVVAFWDGFSSGTRDTLKKAVAAGKPISVFDHTGTLMPKRDVEEIL
jgi:hypothetical protein